MDAGDKQCLPEGRGTEGRIDSGSPHSPSPLRGTSPAARVPVQNTYKPSAFFDFLVPNEAADEAHGALAAGALERVTAPHLEDEVTCPEGPHVADPAFGRCGDKEDLGGM